MSMEKAFRELVQQEVSAQMRPVRSVLERMQEDLSGLDVLRNALTRLGGKLGNGTSARRGSGRPPSLRGSKAGAGKRGESGSNDRPCALIGCKRDARSKGYCAAHYQKLRNLAKTDRLPADWKEYAPANSVADIALPRGRAGAMLLEAARAKA